MWDSLHVLGFPTLKVERASVPTACFALGKSSEGESDPVRKNALSLSFPVRTSRTFSISSKKYS